MARLIFSALVSSACRCRSALSRASCAARRACSAGSIRRAAREPLAPGGEARLQKIQRNLIAAGYGPLKADGRWDDRSASAARRFEADNGWPVTGRPSERLVSGLALAVAGHRR